MPEPRWNDDAASRLVQAASKAANGKPEGEEADLPLKNLSFNKRQINSLFIVTDDRKLWIFPHATYGAQEIGEWPGDAESPNKVAIAFQAENGDSYRLHLIGKDSLAFGIVLAKFAAGTQGLIRPKTDSIESILVEKLPD